MIINDVPFKSFQEIAILPLFTLPKPLTYPQKCFKTKNGHLANKMQSIFNFRQTPPL